jgi:hypothetical protein
MDYAPLPCPWSTLGNAWEWLLTHTLNPLVDSSNLSGPTKFLLLLQAIKIKATFGWLFYFLRLPQCTPTCAVEAALSPLADTLPSTVALLCTLNTHVAR